MTQLILQNTYSYLLTEDKSLKLILWEKLRHRERGYFHNRRYKMKLWDGYVDFFNKASGRFLTGLLPEIKAALKKLKIEYSIQDSRDCVEFNVDEIHEDYLNQWLPESGLWPNGEEAKSITLRDYQIDFVNQIIRHKRGVIYSPTSSGKAQPLDSLVATPDGFVKMEDIKVGDEILVPSGGSAKVAGVFPQGKKSILRVEFSNGDFVECCEDHLWKVNDALYDQCKRKVLTAREIMERKKCPNGADRFNIDLPKFVDFKTKSVPLDPYFIGLLLGDGSFRQKYSIRLSSVEVEIISWVSENLAPGYELKRIGESCDYRITHKQKGKTNPYNLIFNSLGLTGLSSHQKFIPEIYKVNNPEIRLAILQGLMDTRGTVSKKGAISFYSSSNQLSEDVKWIVQSLGGIAWITQSKKHYTYNGEHKLGKICHIVNFTLPEGIMPFRLGWKISRCNQTRIRHKTKTISNVVHIGEKECQCILVDHPEHLYITDNFVVTHNTNIMISCLKSLPDNIPILVLQNRKALAQQNYDEISKWGFDRVGTLWGGSVKPDMITVATVQSMAKMEKVLPKVKVLIVDEIHDMMSKIPKQVYRKLKACSVRMALSATPFKFGEKDPVQKYFVKGFFGPVLKTKSTKSGILTTKELQDRNILSRSACTFYPINEPQIPHDVYADAVTRGIAESWHFHEVVSKLAKLQKGRTLILVDRLPHGDALHNLLPGSLWVQGKDDDETRKSVIRKLQIEENIVAIATQQIFNTGINVYVHNLINAAGGQADHMIIQRMGRGLRTADDKDILNYYDFVFNINDYLLQHSNKRIKILTKEGHEVIVKESIDFL